MMGACGPRAPLTELCVSPSTSRSYWTFQPRRFSTYICCDPWYQMMYDGCSNAPLTTHLNITVLPAFTYRSGSPISSVRGTAGETFRTCNFVFRFSLSCDMCQNYSTVKNSRHYQKFRLTHHLAFQKSHRRHFQTSIACHMIAAE